MTSRLNPISRRIKRTNRLIRRMKRGKKILLFGGVPLAILSMVTLIVFYWSPHYLSDRRYLTEQGKGSAAILFSEGSILFVHLTIYLGATLGLWLFYHFHEKRAFKIYSIVLVVLVLLWSTWNLTKASRRLAAVEAERMCDETVLNANDQLDRSPRTTSKVIILDQAIARIVSYIHIIVRSEFPEFKLRTVSLHMVAKTAYPGQVWNVIQEGTQAKDADLLPLESLVGRTISEKKTKYCPDVNRPLESGEDCGIFKKIDEGSPGYKSLVCFPIKGASPTDVFAGLCFDSKLEGAFGRRNDLDDRVQKQLGQLAQLLRRYRNEESYFFETQPIPSPTTTPAPRH